MNTNRRAIPARMRYPPKCGTFRMALFSSGRSAFYQMRPTEWRGKYL